MVKIRVSRVVEGKIRKGFPWVFRYQAKNEEIKGNSGDLAVVYDRGNHFLAIGLLDFESDIILRILQTGKPVEISQGFFAEKFIC